MARMIADLAAAKTTVATYLDIADGDADKVFASLTTAQRNARQHMGYTADQDEDYAMLRLALADITGNPHYRGC